MSDLDDLLPEFQAEAADILEKVHRDLDNFIESTDKPETLNSIFRGIHTIKGSSSMFELKHTKQIAHSLETYLSEVKATPEKVNTPEIEKIRAAVRQMEQLIKNKDIPPSQSSNESTPGAAAAETPAETSGGDFIRVPVPRMNDTLNAISEVFLIRNQMVYLVERYKSGAHEQRDFLQMWELLDGAMRRGIGELERSAMGMRMMSVQGLFSRMNRIVQSYVNETGKKIQFKTEGEGTELDKKVLDILGEPLVHLIRNAMDHGIEGLEERAAKGKEAVGCVSLAAMLSGNEVILKIEDDGRGIDPHKLLEAAKKKGLDTSHVTDDRSAIDLIFMPGFSTAEKISETSGRGVGMDAVRTSVQSLGGRVSVSTEVGKGSTFTIRLPLSMSLVPSILVVINGLRYAIPNNEVLEARQISTSDIKVNGGKSYVHFRNRFVPCTNMEHLMDASQLKEKEFKREVPVIFFTSGSQVAAVQVSTLEYNTEIVVKPVSTIAPKIPFITGVSVLPTGEPIFILSLVRFWDGSQSWELSAKGQEAPRAATR